MARASSAPKARLSSPSAPITFAPRSACADCGLAVEIAGGRNREIRGWLKLGLRPGKFVELLCFYHAAFIIGQTHCV